MVMVMGGFIMPHEKLHTLFGLILMTQYFTDVTTSVSLLSSPLSPSLSEESSSSSSSKSLLLSASSYSSSSSSSSEAAVVSTGEEPQFRWPPAQVRSQHHQHHTKSSQQHSRPAALLHSSSSHSYYLSHHHHPISNPRQSLKLEREVPIKISHNSKHQKRHAADGVNSGSQGGNHVNNRILGKVGGWEGDGDSSSLNSNRETHLLSTSSPSISLSSRGESSGTSSPRRSSNNGTDDVDSRYDINSDIRGQCRHKTYLPPDIYELDTCAWCYRYMKDDLVTFGNPSKKLKIGRAPFGVKDPSTGNEYHILPLIYNGAPILANVSDSDSPIWDTFANEGARRDWTGCCQAAKECCERMVESWKHDEEPELDGTSQLADNISLPLEKACPPTWDGWQCWNSTKAGVTAKSYCPHYIYFLTEPPTCSISLEKECAADGNWAERNGREWTNYTVCGGGMLPMLQNRAYVLISAYAISIVALVPAVIIFFSFIQLRVPRIILHQNLFFSLIINAVLVIVFKTSVMMSETNSHPNSTDGSIVDQNSIACRLLLISTKYSRMTNYMWMFCEGFYLHKLIAAAFAEQKSLLVFYLIGWVFPLFPTAFYAGFRILAANDKCWVVPQDEWEWSLNGPSLLSLLVNALFLINIIRVLVTKLRAAHAQEPSQYRKAVRATLVLLPLFGLHFIVTIYRPSSSSGICQNWTELYFYANDVADGMQGFMVALIFCYCNGEVLSLIKRSYTRWKEQYFDVGPRRNSRHRPSRGSVLGRSVVSTHIYSSIPPSPETNVIALPGGSNSTSKDPSPTAQPVGANLLTVNGASGAVTVSSNTAASPNMKKSDSKSSLKNRKNHASTATNGNAINMYVSSEYGSVKENPGVEISCV